VSTPRRGRPAPPARPAARTAGRSAAPVPAPGPQTPCGRPRTGSPSAGDSPLEPAAVLVGVLQHTAGPAGVADAEDRTDVGVGDGGEHALVVALDRFERLDEEQPLLEVLERDRCRVQRGVAEVLGEARPQPGPLAVVGVLVEP